MKFQSNYKTSHSRNTNPALIKCVNHVNSKYILFLLLFPSTCCPALKVGWTRVGAASIATIPVGFCTLDAICIFPSTAQYFGATIVLLATSTSLTVMVLNVHYRGSLGRPVPSVVQLVVLVWLAWILGLGKQTANKHRSQDNTDEMVGVSSAKSV